MKEYLKEGNLEQVTKKKSQIVNVLNLTKIYKSIVTRSMYSITLTKNDNINLSENKWGVQVVL